MCNYLNQDKGCGEWEIFHYNRQGSAEEMNHDAVFRGFAKKNKFQKSEITMIVGGWVLVSLGILLLLKNRPKIALNQY